MKKIVTSLVLSALALFATTININSGWNLIGAVGAITPSQIKCAKTIWTYEGGAWKLYVKGSTDTNNYGFAPLTDIKAGQGFWVNSDTDSCNIDFSNLTYVPTEGKMFLANGLVFLARKDNVRYTIPGNTVSYDENNKTFALTAVKNTVSDSRSGITIGRYETPQPLSLVEATLNLQTANTTSNANRAQLNIGNIPLTHFDANTTKAFSGVTLGASGIYVWFEIDFADGTWKDIYDKTISNESMVSKNVTVKAFIEGKNIKYEFSGDYTGAHTIDTTQLYYNGTTAEINGGIGYAELRSRVKVADSATDSSIVIVSDIKTAPYIEDVNATATGTASFSDIGDFIIPDDNKYMNFTKGTDSFSAKKYDYNGSNWQDNGGFSGTVNGSDISISDTGEGFNFEIYHTQKVNGYSDLYMHFVKTTVTTAPNDYEYDTWNWSNPSYYDPAKQQNVQITNLDSLIAGFTTANDQGGGIRFGDDDAPMFLDQNGTVVLGKWTGGYYNGCTEGDCKIYVRTDNIVGTWSEGNNKINVETPQEYLTFEVKSNSSGDYNIVEGDKDKVGAVSYDIILSGANATDKKIRPFLTSNP